MNGIFPYVRFGRVGFLVVRDDDGTVQNEIAIDQIVEVVGVVVQGEHIVESGLEGEVVEKVMVEDVVEEMGVVVEMYLVEGMVVLGDKHWRGLPRGPQGRTAQNTFFLLFLLRYFILFFKLVVVSILVSEVSILVEAGLVLDFFFACQDYRMFCYVSWNGCCHRCRDKDWCRC